MILVVVFDERSSLGLVRLRVKKAGNELAKVFEEVRKKAETEARTARLALRRNHGRRHRQPLRGLRAPIPLERFSD